MPSVSDPYGIMEAHQMNIVKFTPEQIAEFYAATQGVRDKWTKEIGPELVSAAEADMKAVR